jgi:hypothetical protein
MIVHSNPALRRGLAAPARSSPVILSAAKDLAAARDSPFAEFTLERSEGLRVTQCDCSNGHVQFIQIEPCLKNIICIQQVSKKYGANAPYLHHISFAPAWGAVPEQRARENPKKIMVQMRHICTISFRWQTNQTIAAVGIARSILLYSCIRQNQPVPFV